MEAKRICDLNGRVIHYTGVLERFEMKVICSDVKLEVVCHDVK